jgi:hypothetical protein
VTVTKALSLSSVRSVTRISVISMETHLVDSRRA